MTREDAAKFWPIIKAFGEGKRVEYHDAMGWSNGSYNLGFGFDGPPEKYRIAPREFWLIETKAGEFRQFSSLSGAESFGYVSGKLPHEIIHVKEVE